MWGINLQTLHKYFGGRCSLIKFWCILEHCDVARMAEGHSHCMCYWIMWLPRSDMSRYDNITFIKKCYYFGYWYLHMYFHRWHAEQDRATCAQLQSIWQCLDHQWWSNTSELSYYFLNMRMDFILVHHVYIEYCNKYPGGHTCFVIFSVPWLWSGDEHVLRPRCEAPCHVGLRQIPSKPIHTVPCCCEYTYLMQAVGIL